MSSSRGHRRPVVAIIGTTGVGKSQLAVSLAKSFSDLEAAETKRGVVLSADSMQLYKGLDVITNKVTEEEMEGIEHWGLDLVDPEDGGSWEVGRWCSEADRKISSLDADTLPIVCGGTHYFIQHFLFPPHELSLKRDTSAKGKAKADNGWTPPGPHPGTADLGEEQKALLNSFWKEDPVWPPPSNQVQPQEDHRLLALFRLLEAVDPDEAGRWHWRDGRKVRRGLERWWESGSESASKSRELSGRQARFRTLVFWVYHPLEALKPRLNARVDVMLEKGLLREIAELRVIAGARGSAAQADHTEGIFQSIGYKEFAGLDLDQPHPELDGMFPAMLERMKLSTQQYARSQLKWIKKQFLPTIFEAKRLGGDVYIYVVPGGSDHINARRIMKAFLEGGEMPEARHTGHPHASALLDVESNSSVPDTFARQQINARQNCEICSSSDGPYSVMSRDWDGHIKSKVHKRNLDRIEGGQERRRAEAIAQGRLIRERRAALAAAASAATATATVERDA